MKFSRLRPVRLFVKLLAGLQKYFWIIFSLGIISLLTVLGLVASRYLDRLNVRPQNLLSFFGNPRENLDSTGGITNFLILGIRGEGGDSADLSDTIIVASYNHKNNTTSLISVPRDLWVPSLRDRLNTAYYYGEQASPGAGINLAQGAILEDLGLPVHYTAIINFSLFRQAIDLVGGLDINIDPGFVDKEFPIPGKENALPVSSRYETITFSSGPNHLDGETALKFVRSRHSVDKEGTDFARSARQQQVIAALRQKIIHPSFLLDKSKVDALLSIVENNLKSNVSSSLYPTLAKLALDTADHSPRSIAITDTPDQDDITILYHPPVRKYDGKWVLMPKDDNWVALKQYIKNSLAIE